MATLKPRQPVPKLSVNTLRGDTWILSEQKPKNFSLIVFYRGLHCPKCHASLSDLDDKIGDFNERGVEVIAISCDEQARAQQTWEDWVLEDINIGYGMSIDKAREWGLYISSSKGKTSVGIEEPPLFSEPGLFLVRPDDTLFLAATQSVPFARPHFSEVLQAVDFVIAKDYPPRGDV